MIVTLIYGKVNGLVIYYLRDKIFRKMAGRTRKNETFLAEGGSSEV